ncbi:MAG: glycosyltransferase, partial [Thermodesulfobacteriota bacterium]|nr:glycosyltransferase [Thermodesulfobacteriota bacterium]
ERFTSTLLSHLNRDKFKLMLCLVHDDRDYFLPDYVPVMSLDKQKPWHFWQAIFRLRRIIEQTRPRIVLSTIAYINRMTGLALTQCPAKPIWIARVGNDPAFEACGWFQVLIDGWNRFTYSQVDRLITNSEGLALGVKSSYPFAEGRIHTIYNPTDFEFIDQLSQQPFDLLHNSDIPVVISVGRLDNQKRPDVLLESFAQVRRHTPAVLWICGDGPLREKTARDIAARGLGDSVKLLGFQQNPYALMRQATVFVMTSDHEGLPNALIEAQGLGIPAVSTRCPYGPDEIIEDGKTGILVNVGDSRAIAEAIEGLLTNPQHRKEMAEAARNRARSLFDKSTLIKAWEDVLMERS